MEFGKIINGELQLYVKPENVLCEDEFHIFNKGYKPIIRQTGTGGTYETVLNIFVETPEVPQSDWEYDGRPIRLKLNPLLMRHPTAAIRSKWIELFNFCQAVDIPTYFDSTNMKRVFYLEMLFPDDLNFIQAQIAAQQAGVTDIIYETKPV